MDYDMPCSKQEWRNVGALMGFLALKITQSFIPMNIFVVTEFVIAEP
jgi:hypothetical protein